MPAQAAGPNGPGESPASPPLPSPSPRRLVFRSRLFQVTLAIGLVLYGCLAVLAKRYAYFAWDLGLARWIQSVSVPGFNGLMRFVSVPGSGATPFVLVLVAAAALLIARLPVEAAVCCIGVALGSALDTLLKEMSGRPRPTSSLVQVLGHFTNESFPSGHVFFYVEFFGFLLFLAWLRLRRGPLRTIILAFLSLLIALVGVSRVYLGAHWPSDVAGAYLGGGIWLTLMIAAYTRLRT